MEETWATLERRLWLPEHGLYAEEADENWRVDPYRSESGNLHMTEVGGTFESFGDKDLTVSLHTKKIFPDLIFLCRP